MKPNISIIVPVYNTEKYVQCCIESLMRQTYNALEIIIVNDGSKDKTLELLVEEFELVETPYAYVERIKTKPLTMQWQARA